ncbi:alpha/beta hydrolase [Rhodobacteraceae bacterium B1Z28]|uniref:Alpha/beta hydrolase n=1 Tax=Ruegeria haliotis TaxID=2747601 RepID=A0ABX2PTJ2_9RHOB|nr:alpha/beta hydrolase [Ruegeria haliotis]NVO57020.1 alpha/beta hydrolase [Ruegeria haliotis]
MSFKLPITAALLTLLTACGYPQTKIVTRGDQFVLTGIINETTLEVIQEARQGTSRISTISLQNVPGSANDEASLSKLSRYIRAENLDTIVPSDGIVASGGTDMALMGRRHVIEPGACVGVHSWAAGVFGLPVDIGAELPRDAPEHQLYLKFYDNIGISHDFYWFTLEVAGPDAVHWMSPEEINRFGLSDVLVPTSGETIAERSARCFGRLTL